MERSERRRRWWVVDGQNNRNLRKASKITVRVPVRTGRQMSTTMRIVTRRGELVSEDRLRRACCVRPAVMQPDMAVFEAAKCLGGDF